MKMNKRSKRFFALLLITMMTAAVFPSLAESTEDVFETVSPYRIVLTAPGGWANDTSAAVKVSITDPENRGWNKIEYRMNDDEWSECEDLFDQGQGEISVQKNGVFILRMTDPSGQTFEESAEITSIDLAVPTISASISGNSLLIVARDNLSGIAGIQVNSMLFTTMVNGELSVELDSNMNKFEKLAIRAFDFAGNFSEPITLDNPHYEKPVEPAPSPEPTATAQPTKKPAESSAPSDESTEKPSGTASPAPATEQPAAVTQQHGLGSSLIYVRDDDDPEPSATPAVIYATPEIIYVTPAPTAPPMPTPEPIIQTEYITIGPGMPYQADGNSHTLDVLYSAATNKQFITLQSKNGNTFYLVIDYDKPIDEEAEMYETYFLNLVDERDLIALMSDEEKEEVPTPTPEIIYVTPAPTAAPAPTPVPQQTEPEKKPDQMTAIMALVGILALGGIGAFFLLKNKTKGMKRPAENAFDLDDDDEEETSETEEK